MPQPSPNPAFPANPAPSSPGGSSVTSKSFPFAAILALVLCTAVFASPLLQLARFALHSTTYSYILLIPFLVIYLLRSSPEQWKFHSRPALLRAAIPFALGLLLLGLRYRATPVAGWFRSPDNHLACLTLAYVCFVWAIACAFLPREKLRPAAFPLLLLVFLAPFPTVVINSLEHFLQHRSADVAEAMLSLSGMPLLREGTVFRLPGFTMEVAPECSGVRSTLALFITSLVAGYLFLRSPWNRVILTAAVLPLALLRNGFRIFTLGQLCVNVSPTIIDSPFHHQGGPIFFVLSLIPFCLLLWWLRRSEKKRRQSLSPPSPDSIDATPANAG